MSLAGLESRKRERKVARTQSREDFELPESPLRLRAVARWEDKNTEAQRHRGHGVLLRALPLCSPCLCVSRR